MVLCYHGVRRGLDPGISSVPAARLEAQLDYLTGKGWRPRDLNTSDISERDLSVTLDDGLAGQVESWCQPLKQRGFAATLFVPVAFVGARARWDYAGRDRRHASWSQLADWCSQGHAIGSHGMSHRDLRRLDDRQLDSEVSGSRKLLEDRLGVPVTAFSYPFGRFNARVAEHVRKAGYAQGFTTRPRGGEHDPRAQPRIVVSWLDTALSIEARAQESLWGSVERGKQRIISYWSGGTALRQAWFQKVGTAA
jgi:peptidoglycan/xylan/chitin deacetylase (PgdA/CDA1 family)